MWDLSRLKTKSAVYFGVGICLVAGLTVGLTGCSGSNFLGLSKKSGSTFGDTLESFSSVGDPEPEGPPGRNRGTALLEPDPNATGEQSVQILALQAEGGQDNLHGATLAEQSYTLWGSIASPEGGASSWVKVRSQPFLEYRLSDAKLFQSNASRESGFVVIPSDPLAPLMVGAVSPEGQFRAVGLERNDLSKIAQVRLIEGANGEPGELFFWRVSTLTARLERVSLPNGYLEGSFEVPLGTPSFVTQFDFATPGVAKGLRFSGTGRGFFAAFKQADKMVFFSRRLNLEQTSFPEECMRELVFNDHFQFLGLADDGPRTQILVMISPADPSYQRQLSVHTVDSMTCEPLDNQSVTGIDASDLEFLGQSPVRELQWFGSRINLYGKFDLVLATGPNTLTHYALSFGKKVGDPSTAIKGGTAVVSDSLGRRISAVLTAERRGGSIEVGVEKAIWGLSSGISGNFGGTMPFVSGGVHGPDRFVSVTTVRVPSQTP